MHVLAQISNLPRCKQRMKMRALMHAPAKKQSEKSALVCLSLPIQLVVVCVIERPVDKNRVLYQ